MADPTATPETEIPRIWPLPEATPVGQTYAGGMPTVSVAAGSAGWVRRVLDRVSKHEGSYDALNLNTDGAGLSVGMLQWAQGPGNIPVIARAYKEADPALFAKVFDGRGDLLLGIGRSLAPVDGAVLWKEPWVSRFRRAGREPIFQAAQRRLAAGGEHFQGAVAAAKIMGAGFVTERGMALFFDTAVQQGAGAVQSIARFVAGGGKSSASDAGGLSGGYRATLLRFATIAAEMHRRGEVGKNWIKKNATDYEEPMGGGYKPRIWWAAGDGTYHHIVGAFDLYRDILRRRLEIVNDANLGDGAVDLGVLKVVAGSTSAAALAGIGL